MMLTKRKKRKKDLQPRKARGRPERVEDKEVKVKVRVPREAGAKVREMTRKQMKEA